MISADNPREIVERLKKLIESMEKGHKPAQGTALFGNGVESVITPFWIDSTCGYKEPTLLEKELVYIPPYNNSEVFNTFDTILKEAKAADYKLFLFNGMVWNLEGKSTKIRLQNLY